jgi:hypothetical protein
LSKSDQNYTLQILLNVTQHPGSFYNQRVNV